MSVSVPNWPAKGSPTPPAPLPASLTPVTLSGPSASVSLPSTLSATLPPGEVLAVSSRSAGGTSSISSVTGASPVPGVPALPAKSVHGSVIDTDTVPLSSAMPGSALSMPIQVVPPSVVESPTACTPAGSTRSLASKPLTASEKVTLKPSPVENAEAALMVVESTWIDTTVGPSVSPVISVPPPRPALPARSW